jgi:hypothetical protein
MNETKKEIRKDLRMKQGKKRILKYQEMNPPQPFQVSQQSVPIAKMK